MNEVKLDNGGQPNGKVEFSATVDGTIAEDPDDNDDKDWMPLNELGENLGVPHDGKPPRTISEQIVQVSAEQSPNHPIPDSNCRNSSRHTSPEPRRRFHHLRLAGFVSRYSGYIWPWSLGISSL